MMIVVEVRSKNPQQMPFVETDDMIEALATDKAEQYFNERNLQWGSRSRDNFLNAYVLNSILALMAVDAIAITNQESRRLIKWNIEACPTTPGPEPNYPSSVHRSTCIGVGKSGCSR